MSQIVEFKVGTKFIYLGKSFKDEYDRIQEVTHLLTIDGEPCVRSKFLDTELHHIFTLSNKKNSYSNFCYPLETKLDNGIPMFWDEDNI